MVGSWLEENGFKVFRVAYGDRLGARILAAMSRWKLDVGTNVTEVKFALKKVM